LQFEAPFLAPIRHNGVDGNPIVGQAQSLLLTVYELDI
jgi:hypothetical protein